MNKKLIFFVAGLGRFGESVATTLENMGYEVMAMDLDERMLFRIFPQHWATLYVPMLQKKKICRL
mgnify:CR=1 FL=1